MRAWCRGGAIGRAGKLTAQLAQRVRNSVDVQVQQPVQDQRGVQHKAGARQRLRPFKHVGARNRSHSTARYYRAAVRCASVLLLPAHAVIEMQPQITQITQLQCLPARRAHCGADSTRPDLRSGVSAVRARGKDLEIACASFPRTLTADADAGHSPADGSSSYLRNLCNLWLS